DCCRPLEIAVFQVAKLCDSVVLEEVWPRLAAPTPQPCGGDRPHPSGGIQIARIFCSTPIWARASWMYYFAASAEFAESAMEASLRESESKLTERKHLIFGILGNERRNDTKNDRRKNRQPVSKRDAASPVSMLFAEAPSSSPR